MTAIVVSNTVAENDVDTVPVPVKSDGAPYRFEMLFNGRVDRAYADTAEDLLECLIPRYTTMTDAERLAARLAHAARTQATTQAEINWDHDNLAGCTPPEVNVLTNSRATPPEIRQWSSEVPIVLVDVYYVPYGMLPRPVSTLADVENPPNIIWLRAHAEYDYLLSLAQVGLVDLHEHQDYAL